MINEFFKAFRDKQQEEITNLNIRLGRGNVSDWADYQNKVGEIRGREQALKDAADTVAKLSQEETLEDGSS